jgi:hypothetical protein
MNIDRSNYEIWFIDWLDGNLDSHQVEELNRFLDENPDLKDEIKELSPIIPQHSGKTFTNKEALKKSPADITGSQFEYLCVAFLENDLTSGQKSELYEIIEQDSEKKKTFELIQKTRLSPLSVSYSHKSGLLRKTAFRKIVRFSVIGLSAAAAVTLIITTFLNAPQKIPDTINNISGISVPDTLIKKPEISIVPGNLVADNKALKADQKKVIKTGQTRKEIVTTLKPGLIAGTPDDYLMKNINNQNIIINKIRFDSQIEIRESFSSNALIASNSEFTIPQEDDGRSNIARFISKTFREKILKEKASSDSPIKGYEIAEAGVSGLNKLLGWEMELDKNNDENGELSSVYFSSKLLKFNTPIKKSEALE